VVGCGACSGGSAHGGVTSRATTPRGAVSRLASQRTCPTRPVFVFLSGDFLRATASRDDGTLDTAFDRAEEIPYRSTTGGHTSHTAYRASVPSITPSKNRGEGNATGRVLDVAGASARRPLPPPWVHGVHQSRDVRVRIGAWPRWVLHRRCAGWRFDGSSVPPWARGTM